MKNTITIYGHLIDGNVFDVSPITGEELIKRIWTDDFGVPPQNLIIETRTKNGERIEKLIPFDDKSESFATIINQ